MYRFPDEWLVKLQQRIEDGYVRVQKHADKDLWIYNYTQKTELEDKWDDVTLKCRGLVLDKDGNRVIKCPIKFFNHTDPRHAKVNFDTCSITEKLDGYYISFKNDKELGLIVTSRGSFNNQYVEEARKFLLGCDIPVGRTYFAELCMNFAGDEGIIVTKHLTPKLVIWGEQDENQNWQNIYSEQSYTVPLPYCKVMTKDESISYLEKEVEGVVLVDRNTGDRVKVKTDWFIRRHRLISRCTKKAVWEVLKDGGHITNMDFPDEFRKEMIEWENELRDEFESELVQVFNCANLTEGLSRKEVGLTKAIPSEYKKYSFLLMDGRLGKVRENIWQKIKPKNS